jgi:hypothetical protein
MVMQQLTLNHINKKMQQCIEDCWNCHSICLQTVTYCLQKGGVYAELTRIRLLLDCAEICQMSANFLLRASELYPRTCAICADVCQQCAQDCEKISDDALLKACAEICYLCAKSCRQILQ